MARCKGIVERIYPPTRCARQAKANCEYCWQHDPKPRHERDRQERFKREWLAELREARGTLDYARRGVCERAKQ